MWGLRVLGETGLGSRRSGVGEVPPVSVFQEGNEVQFGEEQVAVVLHDRSESRRDLSTRIHEVDSLALALPRIDS